MVTFTCEKCGHEMARIEEKEGKRSLVVHPPDWKLIVVSKDTLEAQCPQCHHHTKVKAELLRGF